MTPRTRWLVEVSPDGLLGQPRPTTEEQHPFVGYYPCCCAGCNRLSAYVADWDDEQPAPTAPEIAHRAWGPMIVWCRHSGRWPQEGNS